ncbi:hypothetical protein [Mesorhizobium sp. M4A.F.Ca.ET.090.04.2.1]|nr:hypothetical protein [Mesorhizobium sp. M4A.F.Ca.ET.090.04.2.1]
MGGGGNNPDFWGEMMWTAAWIIAAFLAVAIAVGVALIGLGVGWQ